MERRHFTRVQARSLAIVKSRFIEITGEVVDLGLNGVRLKTAQTFDIGKDVQIRLSFNSDSSALWIELLGIVIRHEDHGMVIKFTNIPLDSYVNLRNMISNILNDSYKVFDESSAHITEKSPKRFSSEIEFEKSLNIKVDQQIVPQ